MKSQILKIYEATFVTGKHFKQGTLVSTLVTMKLRATDKESAKNMAKYIRPNWEVISIKLLEIPENNYKL